MTAMVEDMVLLVTKGVVAAMVEGELMILTTM